MYFKLLSPFCVYYSCLKFAVVFLAFLSGFVYFFFSYCISCLYFVQLYKLPSNMNTCISLYGTCSLCSFGQLIYA